MRKDSIAVTPKVQEGYAPSFGWVRRQDLDTQHIDAWEKPDGELYASHKGEIPKVGRIIIPEGWRDE